MVGFVNFCVLCPPLLVPKDVALDFLDLQKVVDSIPNNILEEALDAGKEIETPRWT